ncbi:MAG: tagaturonate reductase [Lachnospiraceae bacterium]|jgi:mannitol-1-phosphate/altronate dehydrogenase|nr:tagaturonate reductase [Lachnospiraceae bacterium]
MEKLSYSTLEKQQYSGFLLKNAPERILQFGEGNFLRAFADVFIDVLNEKCSFNGKVVLVQPVGTTTASADRINAQDGLYTLLVRGQKNGEKVDRSRVISSVSRCLNPLRDYDALLQCAANPDLRFIISNTTESGIVFDAACAAADKPPASFPAKLTRFLYERWEKKLPGFIILSCELIDHNGRELKKCVDRYIEYWHLQKEFQNWVNSENLFCSSLVDRIVPGYPKADAEEICARLGYTDSCLDAGEVFACWVIEGPRAILQELPFDKAGLPVTLVDNVDPYKKRKVRILNGAHTSMVPGAYLSGRNIVRECMQDPVIHGYMNRALYNEILPVLTDLPHDEVMQFASDVTDRFNNPFIDHLLLSIALNCTSKWKSRIMPTVLEYYAMYGKLPPVLTFSFAAYLSFYHCGKTRTENSLVARRGADTFEIKDSPDVLDFFYAHRESPIESLASAAIENESFWGAALRELPGFEKAVLEDLEEIRRLGIYEAMREIQNR